MNDPAIVLYDYALRMVGLPYRWGGDDLVDGLDCSGLCIELLQAVGILPKGFDANAAGLCNYAGFAQAVTPKFGTLVFFGLPSPTHVGFCLTDTLMLEAGGGGSTTTSREAAAKQNAYVRVRPIKSRKDVVGYRHPTYPWEG